jgi:hypothetical protein
MPIGAAVRQRGRQKNLYWHWAHKELQTPRSSTYDAAVWKKDNLLFGSTSEGKNLCRRRKNPAGKAGWWAREGVFALLTAFQGTVGEIWASGAIAQGRSM